jgi:hypothetical protein
MAQVQPVNHQVEEEVIIRLLLLSLQSREKDNMDVSTAGIEISIPAF